jgi:hypothetical protein
MGRASAAAGAHVCLGEVAVSYQNMWCGFGQRLKNRSLESTEKQPQILRLRLPQQYAANFAQDDMTFFDAHTRN